MYGRLRRAQGLVAAADGGVHGRGPKIRTAAAKRHAAHRYSGHGEIVSGEAVWGLVATPAVAPGPRWTVSQPGRRVRGNNAPRLAQCRGACVATADCSRTMQLFSRRVAPDPVTVFDLGAAAGGKKSWDAMVIGFVPAHGVEKEAAIVGGLIAQGLAVDQIVREVAEIARREGGECFGIASSGQAMAFDSARDYDEVHLKLAYAQATVDFET